MPAIERLMANFFPKSIMAKDIFSIKLSSPATNKILDKRKKTELNIYWLKRFKKKKKGGRERSRTRCNKTTMTRMRKFNRPKRFFNCNKIYFVSHTHNNNHPKGLNVSGSHCAGKRCSRQAKMVAHFYFPTTKYFPSPFECVRFFFFAICVDGVSLAGPHIGGTDPIFAACAHLASVRVPLSLASTLVHILKQSLAAPF